MRAAVTVHLHAGEGVISEYLETSIAQDFSLHLYPDYVWVRRRDFYSRMIQSIDRRRADDLGCDIECFFYSTIGVDFLGISRRARRSGVNCRWLVSLSGA